MSETPEELLTAFGGRLLFEREFEGGEGRTLKVVDRSAGDTPRALRVLPAGEPPAEASLLASLRHPAIAAVHEVGALPDGRVYVLRDWLHGSVFDRLPSDHAALRSVLRELLEVLAYVHLRSIVHMDLKPSNLLRRDDHDGGGRLALLDFGLAVRGGATGRGGTPFFASPEQLVGAVPDARSDLFAVGAMTVQALVPERGLALGAFVRRFPQQSFFDAAGIDPQQLPAPFASFVRRCVSRRPERRFPDAQAALEFLFGESGRAPASLLVPDPVVMLAERLPSFGEGCIRFSQGTPRVRRALALHVSFLLGDVHRIEDRADETRIVRPGDGDTTWPVPAIGSEPLARHLEVACGLATKPAARAARWLLNECARDRLDVADLLLRLLHRGEIVPNGTRFSWPAAASGRLDDSSDGVDPPSEPLPCDPEAVREAVRRGRGGAARELWQRLVAAQDPIEGVVRSALARALLERGEPAAALPLCFDLPELRAQALLETGAIHAAESELAAAAEGGDDSLRRRIVAQIASAAGRHDEAVAALRLDGASWQEQVTLAAVLEQAGRVDECAAVLDRCRESAPGDAPFAAATICTIAGHLARRRGRLDDAEREFEAAHERFHGLGHVRHCATALLNLGVLAKDRGDHARAVSVLREARALFEFVGDEARSAMALASIGIAAFARGDADSAVRDLERAGHTLRRLGDRSSGGLALAFAVRARLRLGDRAGAVEVLAAIGEATGDRMAAELERARAELQTGTASPPEHDCTSTRDVDPTASETSMTEAPKAGNQGGPSRELFRAFLSVNRQLARAANLEQAMQHLLATAVMVTGARHGYLLVVDEDGARGAGALRCELTAGDPPGDGHAFSRSLANRAMQIQRAMTGAEALADRDLQDAPSVRQLGVRSALCVPFRSSEGLPGAVYVGHSGRGDAFGQAEVEMLEVLADQAAIAVDRMLHEERIATELRESRRQLAIAGVRHRTRAKLLGSSDAMQRLRNEIRRVAAHDLPVLVLGETGSGKELVARALHDHSTRAKGPFVAENCAALPAELMERELFGHVRGAFTGADEDRPGLLEIAHGGTLFLDEVGDMPLALQARLLRALQDQRIRRIGSTESRQLDIRVVAATHRDLAAMVADGSFRQDLFYRLDGFALHVPPLRERGADVLELAEEFVARHARERGRSLTIAPAVRAALQQYAWPGNVRELQHIVARAALLAEGNEIVDVDLPRATQSVGAGAAHEPERPLTLTELERRALVDAMRYCRGDKAKAARVLGISRTTLYSKLQRHGIES